MDEHFMNDKLTAYLNRDVKWSVSPDARSAKKNNRKW